MSVFEIGVTDDVGLAVRVSGVEQQVEGLTATVAGNANAASAAIDAVAQDRVAGDAAAADALADEQAARQLADNTLSDRIDDAIAARDPGDITLIFDNHLI